MFHQGHQTQGIKDRSCHFPLIRAQTIHSSDVLLDLALHLASLLAGLALQLSSLALCLAESLIRLALSFACGVRGGILDRIGNLFYGACQ